SVDLPPVDDPHGEPGNAVPGAGMADAEKSSFRDFLLGNREAQATARAIEDQPAIRFVQHAIVRHEENADVLGNSWGSSPVSKTGDSHVRTIPLRSLRLAS